MISFPYMRAYRDWDRNLVVCYPIFIAQMVLLWRWFWESLYEFTYFLRRKVDKHSKIKYQHKSYALGFSVSKEMLEDDMAYTKSNSLLGSGLAEMYQVSLKKMYEAKAAEYDKFGTLYPGKMLMPLSPYKTNSDDWAVEDWDDEKQIAKIALLNEGRRPNQFYVFTRQQALENPSWCMSQLLATFVGRGAVCAIRHDAETDAFTIEQAEELKPSW